MLRRRDTNSEFSRPLVDELAGVCESLGIVYRFKDEQIREQNAMREREGLPPRSLGRTELGRVAAVTGGEINGATLQIPTTGFHTNQETASLDSVGAALRLTDHLIARAECPPAFG